MRVFFDEMLLSDLVMDPTSGGRIGYIHRGVAPIFRYTAFSNDAFGSSDRRVPKPIPGQIEAIHYRERGAGSPADLSVGSRAGSPGGSPGDSAGGRPESSVSRLSDEWLVEEVGDGTFAVELTRPGEWLAYTIHVERDGLYEVDVMAEAPYDAPVLEWQVDGVTALMSTLPEASPAAENGWFKVPLGRSGAQSRSAHAGGEAKGWGVSSSNASTSTR